MPELLHSQKLAQDSPAPRGDVQRACKMGREPGVILWLTPAGGGNHRIVEVGELFQTIESHPALPGGRRPLPLSVCDPDLSSGQQEDRAARQTLLRLFSICGCSAVLSPPPGADNAAASLLH